ncbi:MAG: molybdopterin molybdotransferase MoeA, partial [Armatimonadetes bacterium]|nr:molybdopterin molybdotransferase MoeA [Armatimonadota bacterium]
MLTYDEALARVLSFAEPLPTESVSLMLAHGRALAADIVAAENLPPFDNSAVDGYAVRYEDTLSANDGSNVTLSVRGGFIQLAGEPPGAPITPGSRAAVSVMTGGTIPPGADAIVMIEDTVRGDFDYLYLKTPASPRFIRRAGSDVAAGQTVLRAGDTVNAGAVGLLASLGMTKVSCHALPCVGILSTGNELVPMETRRLPPAKIRDSNRHALAVATESASGIIEASLYAPDDRDAIRNALLSLSGCDVIVSSGGVSVGSADFVKEIVEEIGTLDFWRIAIKPGKPLAFGRIGNALFFGLPGNPASS